MFPEGVEGGLIYDFGYCETPLVAADQYTACVNQELTFEDIVMAVFPKHAETPFGYIQVRNWQHGS